MSDTIQDSYASLITALRDMERVLGPAVAAQYSAPPGGTGELAPNGIPNPTLDTVIDPRRSALSDAVRSTATAFRDVARQIQGNTDHLSAALSRWEGHEGETIV